MNIPEEKKHEQQKEFDHYNLCALINNTDDMMWSIDRELKLITFNEPFNHYVELTSGKRYAKGDYILAPFYDEKLLKEYQEFYQRTLEGERFIKIVYHRIDGVEYWTETSFYPIHKKDTVIGAACFARDITARKKAEKEKIKFIEEIVQRNKALEQFSHIVSHNLRIHVANILGLIDVIEMSEMSDPEEKKMIPKLSSSAKCLDEVLKKLNSILQLNEK